jgi:hypothetical protein
MIPAQISVAFFAGKNTKRSPSLEGFIGFNTEILSEGGDSINHD